MTGNVRRLKRKSFIGQAVLLVLSVELLFFASFTCVQLPVPTQHNLERFVLQSVENAVSYLPPRVQQDMCQRYPALLSPVGTIRYNGYVPIIPLAVFIGYILGVPLGFIAAATFLVIGLIGPKVGILPLAAGGGLDYWRQPTFGYLIGMLGGSWFAGRVTLRVATSVRQLLAVAGALLITHGSGLIYLFAASLGLLLFQGDGAYLKWQPWLFESVRNLSWYTLPYDVLFSLGLVGIGFPFRWLVSTLTAPDIAMRPRQRFDAGMEQQQQRQEALAGSEW